MPEATTGGVVTADVVHMADTKRAEASAYTESVRLDVPKIAGYVLDSVGQKIAAVAVGLRDARPIRAWQDGGDIREDNEARLRLLYRVTRTIATIYDDSTARAFLRSSSPYLDDVAPVLAIAADREADVLEALRTFLDG